MMISCAVKKFLLCSISQLVMLGAVVFSSVNSKIAIGQPIYSIAKESKEVGVLIGSIHSPVAEFDVSVYKRLDSEIERASHLYMESLGKSNTVENRINFFKVDSNKSTRNLIKSKDYPCLSEVEKNEKNKAEKVSNFDLSPAGYLFLSMIPVERIGIRFDAQGIALDAYIKLRFNIKNLPAVQIEGWEKSLDYLIQTDYQTLLDSSEIGCNRWFKTQFFAKPENISNTDTLINLIEFRESGLIRQETINAYRRIGWSESIIDAFFSKRDARFAANIHETIMKQKPRLPLFVLGAAHIGDPDGVVGELRALGYQVIQKK